MARTAHRRELIGSEPKDTPDASATALRRERRLGWFRDAVRLGHRRHGLDQLVLRYLAALGPATVLDIQTRCGLTRLREVTDRLGSRLVVLRDEQNGELLDLPDAPRPRPGHAGAGAVHPGC